ncbi:MAG: VOC family protein [Sharpea porci]|uniref:SMU1112c/YaeR family gloxylase I-like metalloprotein n=1 Tax=Sharpea porci TaxID=2652286 RepID=UPI00240A276F|nr:VOC family protein [Sharpea porci]MDD6711299.1 VOC family protein [Sharpea porci]
MDFHTIHHIAIIVSDRNQAKEFYMNKLGFSLIRENERKDRHDWKIDLRINESTELEIFVKEDAAQRPSYPEAYGLRHLAFHVDCVDDMVKELEAKDIPCEPIRFDEYTHKKMTFFHDPDGLPIEIHE